MTTLNWMDVTVHDMLPAMTLEKQIRAICSFGGIHDFDFSTELDDLCAGAVSDSWDWASAGGTWTNTNGKLHGVGGGAAAWYHIITVADMPQAGSVTFRKHDNRGAVVLRAVDEDNCYRLFWDASKIALQYVESGSATNLIVMPKVYTGESEVEVAWREVQYTSEDIYRWLFISVWFDGELGLTYGDNIADSGERTLGQKLGFGVYQSDAIDLDNVRVPEFSEIGDWASLDENEAPGGALSRLIGGRHVRMFARYDGTLKIWKPTTVASSQTITDDRIKQRKRTIDSRKLYTHVRVQGAYVYAEAVDAALIRAAGHRYRRVDMPHLMTEQECVDEAEYFLDRSEEDSDTVDITLCPYVILEPEDRISLPDGEYLLTRMEISGAAGRLQAKYQARKYVT